MGFQIFQFPKIDFHLESISKTRLTNNQKHSAHRFVDRKALVKAFQPPLTFPVVHANGQC